MWLRPAREHASLVAARALAAACAAPAAAPGVIVTLPVKDVLARLQVFDKDRTGYERTACGMRDITCELVGIDPDKVSIEQYVQWVRNHIQPYLFDLTFTTLTCADGSISVLVHLARRHRPGAARPAVGQYCNGACRDWWPGRPLVSLWVGTSLRVRLWARELGAVHERFVHRFSRSERRESALAYLRGLVAPPQRRNGLTLAE
ncbi:hypothetical protein GCM10010345_18090 [Streptomyces canarius]|uniref:Uncharacterized protein n=1 Tax=Streptomyces canarius TaxID=285453 RepID=A0ABQ3CGS9_9ACTN|nr:hypothetical protein GCM10010345_18090 [Streptomyces canarius]